MNCAICGKELTDKQKSNETCSYSCAMVNRAKKNGLNIGGYDITCAYCGKSFHSRTSGKKFCCHKCSTDFTKGSKRSDEWRKNISETQKKIEFKIVGDIECERCHRIFKSNTSLRAHKAHCGHEYEKVRCDMCGKEITKCAINMHKRKHGVHYEWSIREDERSRERIINRLKENAQKFEGTDIEVLLEKGIINAGYNIERQKTIVGCNHPFDFYIPELDMLVEADGDYWHGNKKIEDKNVFQKRAYFRDVRYTQDARRLGHKIIRFWGSDITKRLDKCLQEVVEYGKTGKYPEIRISRCL